jgi:hypothetical protein
MLASQLLNESSAEGGDSSKMSLTSQAEGGKSKRQMAIDVLNYCFKMMPDKATEYDVYTPQFIPLLLEVGNKKLADEIASTMHKRAVEDLTYQTKNPGRFSFDIQTNVYVLQQLFMAYKGAGQNDLASKYQKDFESFVNFAQQGEDGGSYEDE